MKEFLKVGSLALVIGLVILSAGLITLGLMGIFNIATIKLAAFYLIIYLIVLYLKKSNKGNAFIYNLLFILFMIPLLWFLIDSESIINLLMKGVMLDMK